MQINSTLTAERADKAWGGFAQRLQRKAVFGSMLVFALLGNYIPAVSAAITLGPSVPLLWNPNPSTNVVGYKIYYGTTSQIYTTNLVVGNVTNVTITGLAIGTTYYFAATSYDVSGEESVFSDETSYDVINPPPALDPIANLSIRENSGGQNINLTGITSGNPGQIQTLTVTAASSNPTLIATPAVNYTNPNTTGTLILAPATNAYGIATITVTVNNGGASNNVVTQKFSIIVLSTAGSVSLSWKPSLSTNVVGYKIYYGKTSHVYTINAVVGNVTNTTVTGLAIGTTYYYAATSYDAAGDESTFSNEASYDMTNTAPKPGMIANNNRGASSKVATRTLTATGQSTLQQVPPTDQTPAVQVATLTSGVLAGGSFSFMVSGSPGQAYVLQASTNLQDWASLATNTAPFGFVDATTARVRQRFYRIVPATR